MDSFLGILPDWAPTSVEELALSVGSVCSPAGNSPVCKEAGASSPGLRWDGAEQFEVVHPLPVLSVQVLGTLCLAGSLFGVTLL